MRSRNVVVGGSDKGGVCRGLNVLQVTAHVTHVAVDPNVLVLISIRVRK
jgi:hypothetical protein